jgi:NadR type nicotinamide-nucleotide adenylyltransferase
MTKRFRRGLVVGKFAPLHRGHELVIRRAFSECEEVVILSYSRPEVPGCPPELRERWLATLFPEARRLVVSDDRAQMWSRSGGPGAIPANDAPGAAHHDFCGFLCEDVLGVTVDAVFTSEDYGAAFAVSLTDYFRRSNQAAPRVHDVMVDRCRHAIPVSGSLLRSDIHTHRKWLPPAVYASFVKRICLLGGESSGKTTLSRALARELDTLHVPEFGRELWEARAGELRPSDMLRIAETQIAREDHYAGQANEFLFCDTSPLTTLFYSQFYFGAASPELVALASHAYDGTVLCAPDFEFAQDGTRQDAAFRARQHEWYMRELAKRNVEFMLATGTVAERVEHTRVILKRSTLCHPEAKPKDLLF